MIVNPINPIKDYGNMQDIFSILIGVIDMGI